ncbi:MAG: type II toxin-antitoxin system RelE/ParE family toxin [Anaerolineae bacterium]
MVFYQYVAHCRLRVGDYRVFYDIDDENKVVLLLAIERRRERTYKRRS